MVGEWEESNDDDYNIAAAKFVDMEHEQSKKKRHGSNQIERMIFPSKQ
jgi:hypothetical protein